MINLIPKPIKANLKSGKFTINKNTTVSSKDKKLNGAIEFLNEYINKSVGYKLNIADDGDIEFIFNNNIVKEGYIIDIDNNKIKIEAGAYEGAFYAVQTIRQLFEMDLKTNVEVLETNNIIIEDAPRFGWRGLLVDESRHFFGINEIKRLIDIMALHKLNVLHWHLTDDQGWRLEIKKYPLLTEIGGKRKDTQINGWSRTDKEGKPHEGFYTQDQIKEIVKYAGDRSIMVVPEIDMPAHFAAALAGYKWLACRELDSEVPWYFGGTVPKMEGNKDWNRIACAGKDSTYQFIYDVIDECAELFPAPYFHIGGDEAPKDEWKKCPICQQKMRDNNLANEEELQGYFNNKIYEYIKTKNKKLIGWNEILTAKGLDNDVIGQYWVPQRDRHAEKFVNNGGKLIMSKHQAFYFDMSYAQYPLKNTYKFEPIFQGIKAQSEKSILGVEGAMWTEWIGDRLKFDVTLFPRMEALAEVAWTPKENKNFNEFLTRLNYFKKILDANGVWYAEDTVSMPKGLLKRKKDIQTWYKENQHKDVEYNKLARKKLGKSELLD